MHYRLYALRIFTNDWDASYYFYSDIMGLTEKFADASMGWAEFDVGNASLAIERVDPEDSESRNLVGRFLGISLAVEDIEATYHSLIAKGVEFEGKPTAQPWGGVLAHFKDPDGNVLTLLGARETPCWDAPGKL